METASFFELQHVNRRRTVLFLVLGLTWTGILGMWAVWANLVLLGNAYNLFEQQLPNALVERGAAFWLLLGTAIFLASWLVLSAIMYWTSGKALPKLMGAEQDREGRIDGLLEEIKPAAGESGAHIQTYVWPVSWPNAFAAGRSTQSGSIVVSQGLLDRLTDRELKGVLAHEVAHLKNRDATYIVQAIAFVSMLITVAYFGAAVATLIVAAAAAAIAALVGIIGVVLEDGEWPGCIVAILAFGAGMWVLSTALALLLLCALLFGGLTLVVGIGMRCAASAISQSREYIADACAAQFTRDPGGLASALRKISGASGKSPLRSTVVQPLLLNRGNEEAASRWRQIVNLLMVTHPKIEHRIATLQEMAGSVHVAEGGDFEVPGAGAARRMLAWVVPLVLSAGLALGTVWSAPLAMEHVELLFENNQSSDLAPRIMQHGSRTGSVNQPIIHLRGGPGIDYPIKARLAAGTEVAILARRGTTGPEKAWLRVRVLGDSGVEGWVAERLITHH